eukprot:g29322.t1
MASFDGRPGRSTSLAGKMQLMHSMAYSTSPLFHSKSTVLGMSRSDWSETSTGGSERFPNGTTKKIFSDGSEEVCFADGTIKQTPAAK